VPREAGAAGPPILELIAPGILAADLALAARAWRDADVGRGVVYCALLLAACVVDIWWEAAVEVGKQLASSGRITGLGTEAREGSTHARHASSRHAW
jgi:hypothetical protein